MPPKKPPQDQHGNKLFFSGENVTFYLAQTGDVEAFLSSKKVPSKALIVAKGRCQLIDNWKGAYQDQTKWKPMGKIPFNGKDYALAALKIVNMEIRIGCVTQPGYNYFMVYALRKKGDDWKPGEITQFENAAIAFLNSIKRN